MSLQSKFTPENLIASAQKASDLIPHKIIDDNAETIDEIFQKKEGSRINTIRDQVNKLMKQGKLERVWKRNDGKVVAAYRLPKS